jgi:hypothetical protein
MTSPSRETEAQLAESQVEQIVHTKAKASLTIKRGKIRNLEGQKILNPVQRELVTAKTLNQERREKAIRGASEEAKMTARILNQELQDLMMLTLSQEARELRVISNPEAQGVQMKASNQEVRVRVILNQDHPERAVPEKPLRVKKPAAI